MTGRVLGFGSLALALAILALGSACASMQVPNNPTTQALGEAGAVSGAVASTIAVVAPAPWGQILAGILGAFSVIAGIVAHSTVSKPTSQQLLAAVAAGASAAGTQLQTGAGTGAAGALGAADAGLTAAGQALAAAGATGAKTS
ncbi:MAG: hypothetical protein ABSC42_15470 [Tepidisphaeraceae bacterium]